MQHMSDNSLQETQPMTSHPAAPQATVA